MISVIVIWRGTGDYLFNAFFGRCSVSFGLLSIDRSGARVHTQTPIAGYETEIYSTRTHFIF